MTPSAVVGLDRVANTSKRVGGEDEELRDLLSGLEG